MGAVPLRVLSQGHVARSSLRARPRSPSADPNIASTSMPRLRFDDLPELRGVVPLHLALAAVIEAEDGQLSYWALKHPRGKPDFHRAAGFVASVRSPASP